MEDFQGRAHRIRGISNEKKISIMLMPLHRVHITIHFKWIWYGNISMHMIPRLSPSSEQGLGEHHIRSIGSILGMVSGGSIVFLLPSRPGRMGQPTSLSSWVRYDQCIQKPPNAWREWPECWESSTGRVTCPTTSTSIHK